MGWRNSARRIKVYVVSKIKPMVEVFALEQAALAFEKIMTAKVHFRAVLKIRSDKE